MVSGSAALFSYWLIWPLEVIKNMTQADKEKHSSFNRARLVYLRHGLSGFYRGIGPGSSSIFFRNGSSMIVMLMF